MNGSHNSCLVLNSSGNSENNDDHEELSDGEEESVSLWNLIDPAPYCVGPDFPLQRIYPYL